MAETFEIKTAIVHFSKETLKLKTDLVIILGRMTMWSITTSGQNLTLDVMVNKPFKDYLKQ